MKNYIEDFKRELKNRNYARTTIKTYSHYLKSFLQFSKNTNHIPEKRISVFLEEKFPSTEQRSLVYSSIKIFYELIIKKKCPYLLKRVRKRQRIPDILTKNEILQILGQITNPKHKAMITFLYGSGLRVSEICTLKIKNIDLEKMCLRIKNAKGHKDRITLLSQISAELILPLIKNKKPNDIVFNTISNKRYSVRTIQKIFQNACVKSCIQKSPTCHTLRHCFATHLLEAGVDLKTIRNMLGHRSIKTTMIYLQLADPISRQIKSPL